MRNYFRAALAMSITLTLIASGFVLLSWLEWNMEKHEWWDWSKGPPPYDPDLFKVDTSPFDFLVIIGVFLVVIAASYFTWKRLLAKDI